MNVFYGTMTSKGQTTVPAEVRELLSLKSGDRLRYVVRNGEVILRAKNRKATELAGILHRPNAKVLDVEDMDGVLADAVVDHVIKTK